MLQRTPSAVAWAISSAAPGSSGAMVIRRILPSAASQKRSNSAIEGASSSASVCTPRFRCERKGPSRCIPSGVAPRCRLRASSNLDRKAGQRSHRLISGRGDGRRKISPDAAAREISPDRAERLWSRLHHVVSRTAMNVNIDIGRNQGRLRKAMRRRDALVVSRGETLDTRGCDRLL